MPRNLYKRGATWWGRVTIGGVEQRRSLRTSDKREANARLDRWISEADSSRITGDPKHSFKDAVAKWTVEFLPGNVAPQTNKRYMLSLRPLGGVFGPLLLKDISRATVTKFVSARRADGVTNATIRRDLTALSSVLEYAKALGWISHNPALDYDRKKLLKEMRDPIELPSAEDIAAAIAKAPPQMAALLTVLQHTGMRLNEAASLTWPQIDVARSQATLTRTKRGKVRVVPLDAVALKAILAQKRHTISTAVFWHDDGRPYSSLSTNLRRIIANADQRFRVHDLRHWFAVEYLKRGGDIYRLSRIMGHSTVKTTEIYLDYIGRDAHDLGTEASGLEPETDAEHGTETRG